MRNKCISRCTGKGRQLTGLVGAEEDFFFCSLGGACGSALGTQLCATKRKLALLINSSTPGPLTAMHRAWC